MSDPISFDFSTLYANFHYPITNLDCGKKCSPYNQHAVPFCCDTRHAIPTAYLLEWDYLRFNTDLWHLWQAPQDHETARLREQTPEGQVLIVCQGHLYCQRQYRALTCRAFPFFPYLNLKGDLLGLSYYWQYEDRCWVISHLDQVSSCYLSEFIATFETLFQDCPAEREVFRYHSSLMRRVFSRRRRAIPLLHKNGCAYKVSPSTGRMRKVPTTASPQFGPYKFASRLAFPDEVAIVPHLPPSLPGIQPGNETS